MEYYPKRTSKYLFRVAKFDDTDEPSNVYIIEVPYSSRRKAKCSCRKHTNCLHTRMIEAWAQMLYPVGGFFYWPADYEFDEQFEFFSLPGADGFYFDRNGGLTQ